MSTGLICEACETKNAPNAIICSVCAAPLHPSIEEGGHPIEKNKKHCLHCGGILVLGHAFCGYCGTRIVLSESRANSPPVYYHPLQIPGKFRLTFVVTNEEVSHAYALLGDQHTLGRTEGDIVLTEDPFLSSRHATFFYRDSRLFVKDEESKNGTFLSLHGSQVVSSGTTMLMGEQVLRVDSAPKEPPSLLDAQGTYLYAPPHPPAKFLLKQILIGGDAGQVYRSPSTRITLGRTGNDVNFEDDTFLSEHHAQILFLEAQNKFQISDLHSTNGTFLQLEDEAELTHGDYLFIGQHLIRVEAL